MWNVECRRLHCVCALVALVVLEEEKSKNERTLSHIWENPLTYFETAVRSCPLQNCSFAVRILFCVYDRYMAIIDEKLCTYVSIAASLFN